VGSTIAGANQYLRTVRDIGEATGYAATEIDGVLEAMNKVNIGVMEAQNTITVMSVKMARYRMEVERTGSAQSDSARIIKSMGVTAEMGVEESFRRMAVLAEQQKLKLSDLVIGFEMERAVATKLIRMLQQGPEALTATMDALRQRGIAVTADNIEAFGRFEQAQIAIKSAWDRIFIVVAGKVYPVLTDLMNDISDKIDEWSVKAGEWGSNMARWMGDHLGKAILVGKILAANALLVKFTGMGMGGQLARFGRWGKGFIGRGQERAFGMFAPTTATAAYREQYRATWRSQRGAMAAPTEFIPSVMQTIVGTFYTINPLVIAIAGAAAAAALAARAFHRNVWGLRDSIEDIFARIDYLLQPTVMALDQIEGIDPGGIFQEIADIFGVVFLKPVEIYLRYTELFIKFVRTLGTVLGEYPSLLDAIWIGLKRLLVRFYNANVDLINKLTFGRLALERKALPEPVGEQTFVERFKRVWGHLSAEADAAAKAARLAREEEAARAAPGAGGAPREREKAPYNDFRGSRFDIKQSFAEGFDPDRIAVAFTNDLATLGERRMQSALAPVGAVR